MKRIIVASIVAVAALALVVAGLTIGLSSCAPGRVGPSTTTPQIRGVITSLVVVGDGAVSVRVVWTDDPAVGAQSGLDAAQLTIPAGTPCWRKVAGGYEKITPADLRVRDVVEAWISGPVLESYPVQASADELVVIGTFAGELPTPRGLEPEPAP